jgi:hypothetical protein
MVDPVVGTGLFQYFIRVIPTIYTDEYGVKHHTNQYTTAERFRPFALPSVDGGPPQPQVLPFTIFLAEVELICLLGHRPPWYILRIRGVSISHRSATNSDAIHSFIR